MTKKKNRQVQSIVCENDETCAVVEEALVHMWTAVDSLSVIKPPTDYYRTTIFGSARVKPGHPLYNAVRDLASALSAMGCDVISGGGPGLMQAANEGENLGDPENVTRSIGVGIKLPFEQGVNQYVEKSFTHGTFFTRLHQFVRLSNAFIVVGGGIGTTLETVMMWQLVQVGHLPADTPIILVGEQWAGLVEWAKSNMLSANPQFASEEDLNIPHCVSSVDEAVAIIREHRASLAAE